MNKELAARLASNVVAKAAQVNRQTTLYCTECCTSFELRGEQWIADGFKGQKVADVIQDRLIVCTCGATLGVYAQEAILPGQVVPIH